MIRERTWPLAKVLHTYPGEDNLVRVAGLLCNRRVYRRATNRLVLLVEVPPLSPSRPAENVQASPEGFLRTTGLHFDQHLNCLSYTDN